MVALGDADGRILAKRFRAAAAAAFHQFRRRWLCRARQRCCADSAETWHCRCRAVCRPARQAATRSKPGHAVRIFTGAPMPDGADTVFMQEDVRLDAARQGRSPCRSEARRQCAPRGRRYSFRSCRIARRTAFAAAGCRVGGGLWLDSCGCLPADPGRGVFDRQRTGVAGQPACGCTAVRFQPLHADGDAGAAWLRGQRSRHLCDDHARRSPTALKRWPARHDLILTTGGVSTGEEDHVKAGVESAGTLVLWRMAIKPGRPVAMGIIEARR